MTDFVDLGKILGGAEFLVLFGLRVHAETICAAEIENSCGTVKKYVSVILLVLEILGVVGYAR